MNFHLNTAWVTAYANDLDPFIPEVWAQESLMILECSLVAASLVHRDFSDELARFGDTVNTRRPGKFDAKRKKDCADVTVQDAVAENVAVKLDQHLHVSFLICDGEETKGFKMLRDEYLMPAMLGIAEKVDQIILAQVYQFLDNCVGKLGVAPDQNTIVGLRKLLNQQKVPAGGRNLIVTPCAEAALLAIGDFTRANEIGDDGTALREGNLGRKYGINHFMSNIAPSVAEDPAAYETALVNGAAAKKATSITYDGLSAAPPSVADWVGAWVTIAGDDTPQFVTADSGTVLTIAPGLKTGVADDAVITLYKQGLVNGARAAGYCLDVTADGLDVAPVDLQLVSFGASATAPRYGVLHGIEEPVAGQAEFAVDRPLDLALADDETMGLGPAGDYCWAFHRNALAMVTRPLAAPARGTGALSFVASFNGLSMRVTITYDGRQQGHLVTCDMLMGVKVLDKRLGAVMLAG